MALPVAVKKSAGVTTVVVGGGDIGVRVSSVVVEELVVK